MTGWKLPVWLGALVVFFAVEALLAWRLYTIVS